MGSSLDPRLTEIQTLYRERLPHFVRTAAAIVGDEDVARDVVQDAFAKCIRGRSAFRGEARLETWIWRAVVNTAYSARGRRVPELLEFDAGDRNASADVVAFDLPPLLASLPDRQRLVVFLRYYADLDYRAIAELLEVEVGTVSATLSAAHARLRRVLKEVHQ